MSLNERKRAVECAAGYSGHGKQVIVHVGASSTADAVELARHAAAAGATAVSSLPPAGNYSFEEIRAYYELVAAASDLPFLVYYFPSLAAAIRTTEDVLALCRLPNVVGLKFTDSDFFRLWSIRRSGALVFNGSDEMLLAGLIMGANGGIGSTYNLIPESYVELYRSAREGRWQQARLVQDRINEFLSVILRYPVNPVIKLLLKWAGVDCGACIPPRRSLTAAEEAELRINVAKTDLGLALLNVSVAP